MTPLDEETPARIPTDVPLQSIHNPPTEDALSGCRLSTYGKESVLRRIFSNGETLRSGWLIAIFLFLFVVLLLILSAALDLIMHHLLHLHTGKGTALTTILGESIPVLSTLAAAWVMARIERRRVVDYNLSGANRIGNFLFGIGSGFVALSLLVGGLYLGGWIQFGAPNLNGIAILSFGALWAIAFLLTGLFEEGSFRGYLQFTLARGITIWWAIGMIAVMVLATALNPHSGGAWGVYAMALAGMAPGLVLHLRRMPDRGFWLAAWVTSTVFGYIHTFNDGETWFGIFCAAAIGFVFAASIRLTGSLWWAIGYHAAWDWGQTFFYGTPDSGFVANGHFLTTHPVGQILWSGGVDGPEGSLLVMPIILLTLLLLLVVYRPNRRLSANPLS